MRQVSIINGTAILTTRGVVPVEELTKRDSFTTGLGAVLSPFIVEPGSSTCARQLKLTLHADPFLVPEDNTYAYMTGDGIAQFSAMERTKERAMFRANKTWRVYNGDNDEQDDVDWSIADPFYLNQFTDRAVLASAFAFVTMKENSSQIWLDAEDPIKNRALGLCLAAYGLKVSRQPDTSIALEAGRPACWPSKLLMGTFLGPHAAKIVAEFYAQGIFGTNHIISQRLVDLAVLRSRPMEGYTLDNLSFVEYIKPTKLTRDTTIVTVPENVLIPTPWVQL